ncbi:conserved exported hypothetical protein [Roseovarius sp. EC-HK134]|uniref:hypothetical protein n=1 Tax=unclassified Roseovarius TaxID=2614913 RepID=UPI001253C394|nr:hypothetical protein [Roseovarius sp. EC-SD190]VVT16129.1 conserved exported hypothetical protein [Roseovarius sp. EC-HK134]VVT16713.1 conserved exported hypothetical protein [Roseovarius sp. EC-SD190]
MSRIFGVFRSVVFLVWLSAALASTAIAASIWALQMTSAVAAMSAKAVATGIAHRQQLAKAVAKTKAKARLRRAIVAVPIAGIGAIAYFEEQDFREWLEENPEGTRQAYACEVAALTAEVIDEVLQDLPEIARPAPETVLDYMPECE